MDQAPVLTATSPFFSNVHHGQIQHFQQAVISRKHGFGFCHLAQLAVKSFNGVSGVDQAPYLLGILEVGAEIGPVGSPGLGDFRVFLVPAFPKAIQSAQGCLLVHGGINRLQIGHKGFQILVRHVLAGIAQLVDDAVLDLGLRKNCVDRCVKPCQIVGTGNKNVLYATVAQAVGHGFPELGALVLPDPHTQYILPAIQVDSDGNVDSFLHNLSLAADVVVDSIQKYHCVDRFQRPLLPLFGDG